MSVLPLNQLQMALSFFTLYGVPVVDMGYENVDGQDVQIVIANRTFDGAIDPNNMKELEKIFGGDVSNGDILIITEDTLFLLDQTDAIAPADRKQSFVTYSGLVYRVMNYADWGQQAGVRVYQGRRHVKQNFI